MKYLLGFCLMLFGSFNIYSYDYIDKDSDDITVLLALPYKTLASDLLNIDAVEKECFVISTEEGEHPFKKYDCKGALEARLKLPFINEQVILLTEHAFYFPESKFLVDSLFYEFHTVVEKEILEKAYSVGFYTSSFMDAKELLKSGVEYYDQKSKKQYIINKFYAKAFGFFPFDFSVNVKPYITFKVGDKIYRNWDKRGGVDLGSGSKIYLDRYQEFGLASMSEQIMVEQFKEEALKTIDYVKKQYSEKLKTFEIDIEKLRDFVVSGNISASDNSLYDSYGSIIYVQATLGEIILAKKLLYKILFDVDKKLLIFHELLRATGYNDDNYRLSVEFI